MTTPTTLREAFLAIRGAINDPKLLTEELAQADLAAGKATATILGLTHHDPHNVKLEAIALTEEIFGLQYDCENNYSLWPDTVSTLAEADARVQRAADFHDALMDTFLEALDGDLDGDYCRGCSLGEKDCNLNHGEYCCECYEGMVNDNAEFGPSPDQCDTCSRDLGDVDPGACCPDGPAQELATEYQDLIDHLYEPPEDGHGPCTVCALSEPDHPLDDHAAKVVLYMRSEADRLTATLKAKMPAAGVQPRQPIILPDNENHYATLEEEGIARGEL